MNKKIFLIILSCITIACIIAGACINLRFAAPAFSSVRKSLSKVVKNRFNSSEAYDFDEDIEYEPETRTFTSSLQSFESLEIDANIMGVSIERGNRFEISGNYSKEVLKPNFSISGGTLKVSQQKYRAKLVSNANCKIKITVPYGTTLESADINIDVGAVALKGIDLEDIQVNTDVGAIAVENVEFRELIAHSDVGAVSVELTQPVSEYNIDAKSDVGAIQVNGSNAKRKYNQSGTTNKRVSVKTDVGGIEIK